MKETHCLVLVVFFVCVTIHLEFTDATGLASFDLETNWNTIQCANQNPIVDEKTIILTATGLVWPRDLFCLALRKNLKVSGEYEMSSQLLNVAGNQSIGFAFNAKDENNYDFAYLRYIITQNHHKNCIVKFTLQSI